MSAHVKPAKCPRCGSALQLEGDCEQWDTVFDDSKYAELRVRHLACIPVRGEHSGRGMGDVPVTDYATIEAIR